MSAASNAQIAAYLARIGFSGTPHPDLATLVALHRAHVEAIAWESLDCYAGTRMVRDPQEAFAKIVTGGRGGWCYEMNGLFAWMLESMGFSLSRLAAGVMREELGDFALGNHLALIVRLDRDYLADVGLGSGLIEPVPLVEGSYRQGQATFRLERLDARWWRFHNQPDVLPPSFDFALDLEDDGLLQARCDWLQTDPTSPFRRNAVVQRHGLAGLESLIDTKLIRQDRDGVRQTIVASLSDYQAVLRNRFGLECPQAALIWARLGADARDVSPPG